MEPSQISYKKIYDSYWILVQKSYGKLSCKKFLKINCLLSISFHAKEHKLNGRISASHATYATMLWLAHSL